MAMRGGPCMPMVYKGFIMEDCLADTHLAFLWLSVEDTGQVERVGFRFLGRPGPRRAGLRGVSSFLQAEDANKITQKSIVKA